jgi:hypothetical protein
VPVTSYFWWFSFTGAFALVSRIVCWDWVEQGKSPKLIGAGVAIIPVLVCVAGAALFVPTALLAVTGGWGNVLDAYELLIRDPFRSTFQRPLGEP